MLAELLLKSPLCFAQRGCGVSFLVILMTSQLAVSMIELIGIWYSLLGTTVFFMISLQLFTIYQCMSTKKGKGFLLFKW